MTAPRVVRTTATLQHDGASEYTSTVPLPELGLRGRLLHVSVRAPASSDATSAAVLVVETNGLVIEQPADEDIVFEYRDILLDPSETTASLQVNLAAQGGAWYAARSPGGLRIAARVESDTGTPNDLLVTLRAEVLG